MERQLEGTASKIQVLLNNGFFRGAFGGQVVKVLDSNVQGVGLSMSPINCFLEGFLTKEFL